MDREEINIVRAKCLEGAVKSSTRIVGQVVTVVELAGDENLGAIQARSPNRLPDLLLISIHLRGVDVPMADFQSLGHSIASLIRVDLEDPKTELRNGLAAATYFSALRCLLCRSRVALFWALVPVRRGELIDAVGPNRLRLTVGR